MIGIIKFNSVLGGFPVPPEKAWNHRFISLMKMLLLADTGKDFVITNLKKI